ncbi:MAG: methyltransferase dimerization domain-containing protein [Bacillota bacterium]|nr:methyltransferase dimerization domain-containing protein [Bacillota bacterium]
MENLIEVKPLLMDKERYLRDIVLGFEKGQVFMTALEMDLFTILKEAKSCESLSIELGTHQGVTKKLLDMLFAMELLNKEGEFYSTKDELVPFLVKGEAYFIQSLLMSAEQRNDWIKLPKRLYQGPAERPEKEAKWEYDRERVNWMARRILLGRLQATYKSLSAVPGFNSAKKMIDLGGFHGIFAISFAQMNPELEIVIFDQPGVTEISQEFIDDSPAETGCFPLIE